MKRRAFLQSVGVVTAGSLFARARFADASALPVDASARTTLNRVGLELYAVRKAMRADPERTLAAVRAAGYDDVELLWSFKNFDRTTQQVRDSLAKEGLKAPSAHIDPNILLNDWESSLNTAKQLGHQYLIAAGLPAESRKSIDVWRIWADRFNRAGEDARKAGIWLAFHNEPDHMKPIEGQVPYDLFISRLDPKVTRLQLDVGNMTMGGGDPMSYLSKHRDRYWSFHVKDVLADRSRDTELGKGVVDLKQLLAAVPDIQKKPCFVEHESPTDELAAARANYTYLKSLQF
jgi:sugar phosphate isomerase/epimerase